MVLPQFPGAMHGSGTLFSSSVNLCPGSQFTARGNHVLEAALTGLADRTPVSPGNKYFTQKTHGRCAAVPPPPRLCSARERGHCRGLLSHCSKTL